MTIGPAFNPKARLRRVVTKEEWDKLTPSQRRNLYLKHHEQPCEKCGEFTQHKSGLCKNCRKPTKKNDIRMTEDEIIYGI